VNISILNWLGFEFIEFRCEAEPGGSAAATPAAQAEDVFAQCRRGLEQFGLGFKDNVRSRIWAVDRESWQVASAARFATLTGEARGASSSYITPGHFHTKAMIGLDLIAVRPRPGIEKIITDFEPKRDRPPICYVTFGALVVVSGMTVVLPTLAEQVTTDILPRITGYLGAAGSGWERVANVSCYLHRSQNPEELRTLFRRIVPVWPPRFEIVLVDGYSMDGKLVEIEVTAEREV
jgi:enamine deaminase RidA (YjgF/YER057c/UK114 family)